MARVITDTAGVEWRVTPSGRHTQYGRDELSLEFSRGHGGDRECRYARYSPRGAKAVELALEEVSERALLTLLSTAQPAWTSPDGGYASPA